MDPEKRCTRLSKMMTVLFMTAMLLGQIPSASSDRSEAGTVDVMVVPGSVSLTPSHPELGEVVKIAAAVTNTGPATTLADVIFWDGPPEAQHFIDSTQVALQQYEQRSVNIQWNTTPYHSGFHDIWVTVNPTEYKDTDLSNNNASRETTLTTTTSKVVKEKFETWNGPLVLSDILGVWNIGWLLLDNATYYFAQEYDFQYGIVVDEKGKLTLRNSQILSNHALRILVEGEGQLNIEPGCDVSGRIATRDRAQVSVARSTVNGGTDIIGGNVTITDSDMTGVFQMQRSNVSLVADSFHSNQTVLMSSCTVHATDTLFELSGAGTEESPDTLNFTGASNAWLTGVVAGTINVQMTSMVYIYRYLTMHAEDTSGLAIPYATLWLKNNYPVSEPAQCQTTDKYGDAIFTVITDQLLPGPLPKAVGSFNITGVIGNVQAQTNIQLPYYPTMTAESNAVVRTIIFEPIFYQTGHDPKNYTTPEVLGDPNGPGSFTRSGDMYVWSNLTFLNVPLYIEQTSDFWAGIYIYPTGRLNFMGGGITSNKRLNVYIIGAGQLNIEPTAVMNGIMNINALIGLEDDVHMRGSFNARNIELNGSIMGTFDSVKLSVSTIIPHPYNIINGALAFTVENGDIGNTSITAPPPSGTASRVSVGQSLKFTNCGIDIPRFATTGNVVSFSGCNLSGLYPGNDGPTNAGSLLNLSATALSIIDCTLDYEDLILGAQSFISTSTDYPIPLEFQGSSTGLLTDVIAPAIMVNDSAEVTVQWLFTLSATDAFGSAVEGAEVTVRNYTTNQTIAGGSQSTNAAGKAVFLLLGKKVYANEVVFLGNYKVMVAKRTAGGALTESGPFDISMRSNIDLDVQMDRYNNPLERLTVVIDNLTRYSNLSENDEVFCRGHVIKLFKGGHVEPASDFPVTLTLSTSGFVYNGTTDHYGYFNISFRAPSPSERNITVTVSASFPDVETGSDTVFNLSVPIPRPDGLRINVIGFDHPNRNYVRNKEPVTIIGNVETTLNGKGIGVGSNVTVFVVVNPGGRSFQCTTDAAGGFRIEIGTYSTVMSYTVSLDASISQGTTSLRAGQATAQFNIKKAAAPTAPAVVPLWVIAAVILLVVGVAGGSAFFYLRMQAEAAKLVECGECGSFIPESATKCPKCGTEFETEVVKCSECGSWIPPTVLECPKCGAAFKKKGQAPPKPPQPGAPAQPQAPAPGAPATPQQPQAPAPAAPTAPAKK
jgi:ribosomal protein L40E